MAVVCLVVARGFGGGRAVVDQHRLAPCSSKSLTLPLILRPTAAQWDLPAFPRGANTAFGKVHNACKLSQVWESLNVFSNLVYSLAHSGIAPLGIWSSVDLPDVAISLKEGCTTGCMSFSGVADVWC